MADEVVVETKPHADAPWRTHTMFAPASMLNVLNAAGAARVLKHHRVEHVRIVIRQGGEIVEQEIC
ncbi:hypothetical protein ACXR2T_07685 [Leucobacter sp. HY1910]